MKGIVIIVPCLVLLLLLTACSSQKNMFVLLPDQDGNVGSIEVINDTGSYVADKPGDCVTVADSSSKPKAAPAMNEEQIRTTFGEALAVEPSQPRSFLLYFKTDSFDLTNGSIELLQPIMDAIKKNQSTDVSVIGHADTAGSKEYNFTLSTKRAQTVRNLLVERGVDPAIIEVSSYGEADLLIPTADNVKEPRNRRVEVIIR
ncbi:MAG: OmpA family protein [Proteobacteria bacterium]|nr:OmpA family protein [Pseudomonadota bacterium]MBU0967885.1 OmpA family protein [Pseudomonadota bacterium]